MIQSCSLPLAAQPENTPPGQYQIDSTSNRLRQSLRGRLRQFLLIAFVSVAVPSTGFATDWPFWGGPERTNVWPETNTIDEFPELGPNVVWRQAIGAGYAGPSIVGNHVYILDRVLDEGKGIEVENDIRKAGALNGQERMRCLNFETGETLWSHIYDCDYTIAYPTGPRCTPTVDEDRVYTLGAMGHLFCFNRNDGTILWQKDVATQYDTKPPIWGYASHPLVDGEHLLVPVGGKDSGVVCFNKLTGEEVWKSVTSFDIAYSPLVIYEGKPRQLLFWHADGISGLQPATGEILWHFQYPEQRSPSQTQIATPVVVGNEVLISEFYIGSLLLELLPEAPYVKELWRTQERDPRNESSLNAMMATPIERDGLVYGIGYDRRGRGVFRCHDFHTGEMKWQDEAWLGAEPQLFATAFPVRNGDKYFLFNDLGQLMIARLSGTGFNLVDSADLLEPTSLARGRKVVWSHPAFSQGSMVARNDKEIIRVDLRKTSAP